MTANYTALLADPLSTKAWLCTLWPYDPSHVGPSLVGDGVASFGAALPGSGLTCRAATASERAEQGLEESAVVA